MRDIHQTAAPPIFEMRPNLLIRRRAQNYPLSRTTSTNKSISSTLTAVLSFDAVVFDPAPGNSVGIRGNAILLIDKYDNISAINMSSEICVARNPLCGD